VLDLWIERYRPQNIEDFVWASPNLKSKVDEWIAAGQTPNVLFSGGAGRGKTTLARMLMKALGIPKGDILDINATLERKVDALTDSITGFTSSWAMGPSGIKYVILDEADRLTPLTQDFLRGEIEKHHETVRFILTGNNRRKFTEPRPCVWTRPRCAPPMSLSRRT
jgi:DNA polymerase III delta prime subunit